MVTINVSHKIFTILFVFALNFCHFFNVPFFSKVL
nr:MAG TPA: hypothetical protein [Caudoviricetes sp.]